MKKIAILTVCALLCSLCLFACNTEKEPEVVDLTDSPLVGRWECAENALEDDQLYTGYLSLKIFDDETFIMNDVEAGNPGIEGTISALSEDKITLDCNEEVDFDPPVGWSDMDYEQEFTYSLKDDDTLHICYEGEDGNYTLVFTRDND